ncbi:MAG: septum formation initiator family protein [Clostridia bacterium]|nr:septum formation initiator family protein [Clostridia bacterium]
MKKISNINFIIIILFGISLALLIILLSQFATIANKKQKLSDLKNQQIELAIEIENAEKTLETISSKEYQENQARKNGYSYPNEKRFIEK